VSDAFLLRNDDVNVDVDVKCAPGGMVEPGDTVSVTLKKEFGEEALNSLAVSDEVTSSHFIDFFSPYSWRLIPLYAALI